MKCVLLLLFLFLFLLLFFLLLLLLLFFLLLLLLLLLLLFLLLLLLLLLLQFFLELSYYSQHITSPTNTSLAVERLEVLRRLDPDFAKLEGTAFDTVIAAFSSLTSDMLEMVSTHVTTSLQSSLKPYQNSK